METVKFGKTGMKVSKLCLGCMTYGSTKWREWVLDEEASRPFIREALEKGINFFDTADVYSQGRQRGNPRPRAQGIAPSGRTWSSRPRCTAQMGPNANAKGLSRKHIMEAIDAFAEAPRHGLRRSLPDPPLRSADADGGDAGGAERRRARRQGALYRRFVDVRLAVRRACSTSRAPRATPSSSRCRTTTTSSIARKSAR